MTQSVSSSIASQEWLIFYRAKKSAAAARIAEIFMKEIVRLHGLPLSLVSERDPKFVGQFCKKLNTTLKFSTSAHPQTDGLTEVVNRSVVC